MSPIFLNISKKFKNTNIQFDIQFERIKNRSKRVFKNFENCSESPGLQTGSQHVFKIFKFFQDCLNYFKNFRIFSNIFEFFQDFSFFLKNFRIFSRIFEFFQEFSNFFKKVQKYKKSSIFSKLFQNVLECGIDLKPVRTPDSGGQFFTPLYISLCFIQNLII